MRPTQKAGLLLKAWLAENGMDAAEAASFSLESNGRAIQPDDEIGQVLLP